MHKNQPFIVIFLVLDIRYLSASGGFAFSAFLFRFDRPFNWLVAALNPEP